MGSAAMAFTIAITSSSERPSLAVSRANCGVSATVWRRPGISLCVPMAYVSQWRIQLLWAQPGNRALADVVAVYDRAVALPIHAASAQRLLLLVRGQLGLAVELHTLRLGSHTAGAGALADAPQLELGCDPEAGCDQLLFRPRLSSPSSSAIASHEPWPEQDQPPNPNTRFPTLPSQTRSRPCASACSTTWPYATHPPRPSMSVIR